MPNQMYEFIRPHRKLRPIRQSSARIGYCRQSCLLSLVILFILVSLAVISLAILIYMIPCPQASDGGNHTSANRTWSVPLSFPNLFYAWKCPYFTLYFVNQPSVTNQPSTLNNHTGNT